MNNSKKITAAPPGDSATDLTLSVIDLASGGLTHLLATNPDLRIVRVNHAAMEHGQASLLDLAMTDDEARRAVVELANHAFVAYASKDGVTSFVHYGFIGKLWKRVKDGQFKIDENGMVYSLDQPLSGFAATRLVVVFSPMAENIRAPYLMRHFEQDFPNIQGHLPVGTAVLRIADIGGVVGGYYMNSHGLPDNEAHVQALIRAVSEKLCLTEDDVVLYGRGKGGSASLYHGLLGGFRVVAIDPVVSDEYHVKFQRDSHFTVGVFPESKQNKFDRLCSEMTAGHMPLVAIVCSDRSPQFPYITSVLKEPAKSGIACFNSRRADIRTPPDAMAKTVRLAEMLLNMQLYKLPVPKGMHVVDEVRHREDSGSRAP